MASDQIPCLAASVVLDRYASDHRVGQLHLNINLSAEFAGNASNTGIV